MRSPAARSTGIDGPAADPASTSVGGDARFFPHPTLELSGFVARSFTEGAGGDGPWPGFSTFRKNEDGTIERVASDFFGPGDTYLGLWHMFSLLAKGVDGWQPTFNLPG